MGHQQRHPTGRESDGLADQPTSSLGEREGRARNPRPWLRAGGGALLIVALVIAASAVFNPLLGRYVHWRRIDIGAPLAFVGLALAFRRRWI